jgi:hypothetical protein
VTPVRSEPCRASAPGSAPEVTICVPAYRAGGFLHHTLAAVQGQTFPDFVVDIAIEAEEGPETERACAPFVGDPRFQVRRNATTLGWGRNVAQLLERVTTPFFAILPHDDVWHPRFLEVMMAALAAHPHAVAAFSDLYLFGRVFGIGKSRLPDAGLGARLLAYFLQGAEAQAFRAVTRSPLARLGYPSNDFGAFAVEGEWVLWLLREGVVLRIPEPLYLKRIRGLDSPSVATGWTMRLPRPELEAALEHHRRQMLAAIPYASLDPAHAKAVELAAEAAMLRRWVHFGTYAACAPFGLRADQLDRARRLIAAATATLMPCAREIAAMTRLALARHHRSIGEADESERQARAALAAAPDCWEAFVHLAWLQLDAGDPREALRLAFAAVALEPSEWAVRAVVGECDRRLYEGYAEGAAGPVAGPIG